MPISNYANGFAQGLTVRGVPIEIPHPGKVFWVNNSTTATHLAEGGIGGSNGNKGTYQQPFASIDFAISKCKAGRGDVIYAMPNHVEAVSTAAAGAATVDIDVAGVTIIGLGFGSSQARFDFTLAAGVVTVTADNVTIHGMNFHANVPDVLIGLNLGTAANTIVSSCLFDVETTTTDEFADAIAIGVASYPVIENCVFDMGLGNSVDAILMVGTVGCNIRGNRIVGDYSTANIACTGTLSTEVYIEDNLLVNGGSGDIGSEPAVQMLTGSTGIVRRNHILSDVVTHVLMTVADTMSFFENYSSDDTGSNSAAIIRHNATSVVASADA